MFTEPNSLNIISLAVKFGLEINSVLAQF